MLMEILASFLFLIDESSSCNYKYPSNLSAWDKVKGSKNFRVMCNSMPGVHTHAVGNCTDLTSLIFAFRKPVMKFMSTF